LRLKVDVNGRPLGRLDAAAAQRIDFGRLVALAAAARPLGAGSLVGSGPLQAADPAQGFASRAQQRRREAADDGAPRAAWLQPGDTVSLEAVGADGQSVFGQLLQRVVRVGASEPPPLRGPGAARGAGGRATPVGTASIDGAEDAEAAGAADDVHGADRAEPVDPARAGGPPADQALAEAGGSDTAADDLPPVRR
jgi:hypothetical protein